MNNYRISLADSWHQEAQVIYETWQVILIKCRACGCKVAGREQILSRQRAAERHAWLQTRWAGLSVRENLGPAPQGDWQVSAGGEKAQHSLLPIHNNKHMTHKHAAAMWTTGICHLTVYITKHEAESSVYAWSLSRMHPLWIEDQVKTQQNQKESVVWGREAPLLSCTLLVFHCGREQKTRHEEFFIHSSVFFVLFFFRAEDPVVLRTNMSVTQDCTSQKTPIFCRRPRETSHTNSFNLWTL